MDKHTIKDESIPEKSCEGETLPEYAMQFGGKLGPYEEFNWEEGMGIERWMDAED